jgi:hypothetical protein
LRDAFGLMLGLAAACGGGDRASGKASASSDAETRARIPARTSPPPSPLGSLPEGAFNTTPAALAALQVAGERHIPPDDETRREFEKASEDHVMVPFKLCVDEHGAPTYVGVLTPGRRWATSVAAYGATIQNTIWSTWRYRSSQ